MQRQGTLNLLNRRTLILIVEGGLIKVSACLAVTQRRVRKRNRGGTQKRTRRETLPASLRRSLVFSACRTSNRLDYPEARSKHAWRHRPVALSPHLQEGSLRYWPQEQRWYTAHQSLLPSISCHDKTASIQGRAPLQCNCDTYRSCLAVGESGREVQKEQIHHHPSSSSCSGWRFARGNNTYNIASFWILWHQHSVSFLHKNQKEKKKKLHVAVFFWFGN